MTNETQIRERHEKAIERLGNIQFACENIVKSLELTLSPYVSDSENRINIHLNRAKDGSAEFDLSLLLYKIYGFGSHEEVRDLVDRRKMNKTTFESDLKRCIKYFMKEGWTTKVKECEKLLAEHLATPYVESQKDVKGGNEK
jgi:hypothetical protein